MTYFIDPRLQCEVPGCKRPKATGEERCSECSRLARIGGEREVREPDSDPGRPPRCVVYMSRACDVITVELTGDQKFTEADVERIAHAMSSRRKT